MIATDLRVEERHGELVRRSALLRFAGGEQELWIDVPETMAPAADDASPLLPACLLPAMRRHEDLEIEGPVSPRLLASSHTVQAAFHAWDRSIRRCAVTAAGTAGQQPAAGADGCLFSRGLDSMHAAVHERARGRSPSLVFCERLDPIQGEETRAEERRLAEEAAGVLGLPLVMASTNLRTLTDPLLNWGDMHGGALGFLALSLGGGLKRVLVPSTHAAASMAPWGSSPLVDPLWSTESVSVVHGPMPVRTQKLALVIERAPELIPLLKVCYRTDSAGNCGRCPKCLITLVSFEALGAVHLATAFSEPLDLGRVAALRPANLGFLLMWLEAHRALSWSPRHREIRRAIETMLRRTSRPGLLERVRTREWGRPPARPELSSFARHNTAHAVSLLLKGRPYP